MTANLDAASRPHNDQTAPQAEDVPVFSFLLVKLASRCNIKCTYCYWFRDPDVYRRPAVLTIESEDALCQKLEQHIDAFGLTHFMIVFHGGEPLLFPKHRFVALQEKLIDIEQRTGCEIARGVCTNAILIDQDWVKIFDEFGVSVSVSLDGPPEIHNRYRIGMKGEGTHAETIHGLNLLRAADIEPGLIVVCNPATAPESVLAYVVDELGIKQFDILPPDANHNDNPPPIDDYFIRLFDVWYDRYAAQGVRISTLDAMIQGLLGEMSISDTIGIGPIDTVTLMTDGSLEPLDVLRIAGDGYTRTNSSVLKNALQDVQNDPRWRDAFEASTKLCEVCRNCEYLDACGGGHLAQRWSPDRKYDNPSVYCASWKRIFEHIWTRVSPTLILNYEKLPARHSEQSLPPTC